MPLPHTSRYAEIRPPTEDETYGQDSIRSATFWDSTLGRLVRSFLPESDIELSTPQDSVMDTVGQRLQKTLRYNQPALSERAMSLGTGGSPGLGMVAGPVVYGSRPLIWDIIEKIAPKLSKRYKGVDVTGPGNKVIRNTIHDYFDEVGSKPVTLGAENEVRSPHVPWFYEGNLDLIPREKRWSSYLPEGYDLVPEAALKDIKGPGGTLYGGELITGHDSPMKNLEMWDDYLLNKFPQMNRSSYGERYGGGYHLHAGPPEGVEQWDPDTIKRLLVEVLQDESRILPPVPKYKSNPERQFVPSLLKQIQSVDYTSNRAMKALENPNLNIYETLHLLPNKFEGSVAWRRPSKEMPSAKYGVSGPGRPEFRNFYSPLNAQEAGENMLAVQAIMDAAQRNKRSLPSDFLTLMDEVYSQITPKKDAIREFHRNRWFPEGIHPEGSPYANGLVENPVSWRWNESRDDLIPVFKPRFEPRYLEVAGDL